MRADPMRVGRRHRRLGWSVGVLLALGIPAAGWCQEGATDEIDRWVPAFAITLDVLVQGVDGFLQNDLRPPEETPPDPSTPGPGEPISGSGNFVDIAVGGSLELMSPALWHKAGRPRLFAHGDLAADFSSTIQVAKEGSAGAFEVPNLPPIVPPPGISGDAVGGQGSETSAEIDTLLVSAGAGVAFTVDLAERRLRVKPSFEYVREQVTVSGVVQDVGGQFIRDPGPPPVSQDWVFTSLAASGSETFHGIGPGLELEMDTARLGPFMLTIFVDGRAYRLLGDTKIDLAASDGATSATWGAELDPWLYRFGVGLRFRFLPER